jgi:pyruvate/2-oxoglutarate dehydrogenase complex dihydrolipoamide dehydrogenase (E3) component
MVGIAPALVPDALVVVIERALIGGACPNIACLPSQNVIRAAKVADLVQSHVALAEPHSGSLRFIEPGWCA